MLAIQRASGGIARREIGRRFARKRVLSGHARISRKRGNTNVKGRGEVVSYGQSTYYSEYKVYAV